MRRFIPLFFCFILLFFFFLSNNLLYLDCRGLPLMKGDIDNYIPMFIDPSSADFIHIFYAYQIYFLERSLDFGWGYTIFFRSMFFAWLFLPLVLFVYFCSFDADPLSALAAVLLVYVFSWWVPVYLVMGILAQFECMAFFFLFWTCYNLRKKTGGLFLDFFYGFFFVLSCLNHPYVLFVFGVRFFFVRGGVLTLPFLFGGVAVASHHGFYSLLYTGLSENLFTAVMVGGLCSLGVFFVPRQMRFYSFFMFFAGLFSHTHRLFLFVLPDLSYYLVRHYRFKPLFFVFCGVFSILYSYVSAFFWLNSFAGELLFREGGLDCFYTLWH